jgi:putative transposase
MRDSSWTTLRPDRGGNHHTPCILHGSEAQGKLCGVMKTTSKHEGWASVRALARYDAVRFLEEAVRSGLPLRRALAAAAERPWGGKRYRAPTLEEWYYRYRHDGFEALHDRKRRDQGDCRALSPEATAALLAMRRAHPQVYGATLLRQLERQGTIPPGSVSLTTIYRLLRAKGLDRASLKSAGTQGPTKAFEVSWANQLWMTDGMWGPSLPVELGGKPVRTHLLALIDDCSRLCPHGQYYPAEKIECFLDLFKHALRSRGIPEKLYTDNGSLFTSEHLRTVCANFGIRLIHAKPYAAWSKGKIERFFLTVQSDFEQRLVFEPAKTLAELNERFWHWLETEYHRRAHRGLDGESPQERFRQRSEGLRTIPMDMDVDGLFLKRTTRRVRRDATITLNGRLFEVPVSLRGRIVEVRFDPFGYTRLDLYLDNKKVGHGTVLDKELNSRTFNLENYEHNR